MRIGGIIAALTAFLPSVLAVTEPTPPEYFVIKSKLLPGQTGKESFNNLYLEVDPVAAYNPPGVFTPFNSNATVLQLQHTRATNYTYNHTLYSLKYKDNVHEILYRGEMLFTIDFIANWQPFSFLETLDKGNSPEMNGFYTGTSGSDMILLWTNFYQVLDEGNFTGWLICDWWWELPQLFFVTNSAPPLQDLKVPCSCALVDLLIIPIFNTS